MYAGASTQVPPRITFAPESVVAFDVADQAPQPVEVDALTRL
jgi:hypothetical protein